MAFQKQLLFLFLVSFSIFAFNTSQVSFTGNEEASSSKNNDCYKLKSTVPSLQSIIKEKNQELLTKEEKIQRLELIIREKFYSCESDIDLSQSENPENYASEAEENINGKWLLAKLGLSLNKTQAYLVTIWHQHLNPTLQKKWIPSIKDASVTLTTYLKPKFQYLREKSIEVLYTATQALTPDLIQGYDVSYYYLEVNRIMTTVKLHLEKGQVFLESCIENVRHGFNKLVRKI